MRHTDLAAAMILAALLLALAPVPTRAEGGAWAPAGSMNTARQAHSATTLLDGRLLVARGYGLSGSLAACELCDPAAGLWALTGSLNAAREMHAAVRLANGKVLVVGGTQQGMPLASAELYDPASGLWSTTGGMN